MLPATKISPPITLLQEICARNGLTPSYQLLSTEGSVHEPTFKFAVSVADVSAIASGQSKKKARHAAAREIIDKLRQKPNLNFEGINFDSLAPVEEQVPMVTSPNEDGVEADGSNACPNNFQGSYSLAMSETNPVGKLQEICMKMRVNPPDYDTADERGLAHERVFYLTCSIASLSLQTLGQGRSKKLAKRQAAEKMLDKLESSGIYDKSANSKKNEQGVDSLHIDSCDNKCFVKQLRLVNDLLQNIDVASPNALWKDINMIEEDDVNDELFYDLIHETIPKDFRIEFHYMTDKHCLLYICDLAKPKPNLILTSFGYGNNNYEAMKKATTNAYKQMLILLRPFTGRASHLLPREVGRAQGLLDHQAGQEATAS